VIKQILVGLDGLPLAEAALPIAVALARAAEARLILLRAVGAGATLTPGDLGGRPVLRYRAADGAVIAGGVAEQAAVSGARSYLARVAAGLTLGGIRTETVVVAGEAADVLVDEARLRQVDLVVLATHGRSGVGRWIYGSVAEAVLTHSQVPVLLVREGGPAFELPPPAVPTPIVVPLDGSSLAEPALPCATDLARALGAELTLVRVVPTGPVGLNDEMGVEEVSPTVDWLDAFDREAYAYLSDLAARLQQAGIRARIRVIDDEPIEGIIRAEVGAALVVMATHGRTGLARTVVGSVALDVLRQGTLPVVLVRPAPAAPAEGVTSGAAQSAS
jgi:nucleotide-binding universal stress UspA family protein